MKIKVDITRYVDASFPGWVECSFIDAWGVKQVFIEKVPVVTEKDLDNHSEYPQEGVIACEIIKIWRDQDNHELATINTNQPWGCETINGVSKFDILKSQLIK
jgi:hypothetical protein